MVKVNSPKEALTEKLQNNDLSAHMRHDIKNWQILLGQGNAQSKVMKNILLLIGSNLLKINGVKVDINGKLVHQEVYAFENKLPVTEYLSHGGRIYMKFPSGKGKEALQYLDPKFATSEAEIKPRGFATHDGKLASDGTSLIEKKLSPVSAFFKGVWNKITASKDERMHYGMNINATGYDKETGQYAEADGSNGHVYFNFVPSKGGDIIGIGIEGTAPRKSNELDKHSIAGNSTTFSAFKGDKLHHKLNPSNENFRRYVDCYLENQKSENDEIQKIKNCHNYYNLPWYKRWFTKNIVSKKQYIESLKSVGLQLIQNDKYVLTNYGMQAANAGIVVKNELNGAIINDATIPLNFIQTAYNNIDVEKLPYLKHQKSSQAFIAQQDVYPGLNTFKIALKQNPQWDHATSTAISLLYDCAPIEHGQHNATTQLFEIDEIFNKVGVNRNEFDAKRDMDKIIAAVEKNSKDPKWKDIDISQLKAMKEMAKTVKLQQNNNQSIEYEILKTQFTSEVGIHQHSITKSNQVLKNVSVSLPVRIVSKVRKNTTLSK